MSNSGDSQGTTTPPAATTAAPVDKTYASVVARPPGITNIELRTVVLSIDARFAVDGEVALVGLGIADADGNIGYVVLPGATRSVSIANNIPILAFDTEGRSLVPPESGRFWQLARPLLPGATYEVDVVLSADGETFPPARSPGTAWGRAVIPGPPIVVYANAEVAVSSITAERAPTPLEQIDAQGRGQLVWERVPSRVPQGAWQARFRPEEPPPPPPPPPPPVNEQLRHLAENAQEGLHQMQNRRANEAFWLDVERQLFPPPPPPVPGPSLPPNPAWLERSRLGVNTPDPGAALTAPPPPPPPPQPPQPITPLYVGGTVLGPATFAERRPFDQEAQTEEEATAEAESPFKVWVRRHFRLKDDPDNQRVHW